MPLPRGLHHSEDIFFARQVVERGGQRLGCWPPPPTRLHRASVNPAMIVKTNFLYETMANGHVSSLDKSEETDGVELSVNDNF